jgi:hypothetical protein
MPTYALAIRSTGRDDTEIVNVLHIEKDGDSASGALDVWNDHAHDLYLAMVHDQSVLNDVTATQVPEFSTDHPTDQAVRSYEENGTAPYSDQGKLSPAVCLLAQLKTAKRGRRYRGRMWMPPPYSSNELDDPGKFTTGGSSYLGKCTAFLEAWAPFSHDGWQSCVYSRANVAIDASPFEHITDFALPNVQHWLRSREAPAP